MLADEANRRKIIVEINSLSSKVAQEIYNERIKQVVMAISKDQAQAQDLDLSDLLLPKSKD